MIGLLFQGEVIGRMKNWLSMVELLTRLGCTLSLSKRSLVTSIGKRYIGLLIDSVRQAYLLPDDKKQKKNIHLKESILSSSEVDTRTLQRFCGKCISMCLHVAVPGCTFFCREVTPAISACQRKR